MIANFEPIHAAVEFFTLRRAERRARAYAPEQSARVSAHFEAGERRLRAGRRALEATAAATLLREAIKCYLRAIEAADGAAADPPPLPPDPARPRAEPSDDARVRRALAADDPLYFDSLSREDTERTRWALDRSAAVVRRRVEARSITHIVGTRWGRAAAVALVVAYAVLFAVRAAVLVPNVALGKPVQPSSRDHASNEGKDLVDGIIGTSYGLKTNTEDSPNVVIDLLGDYRVDRVEVYNRVDGWFGDSLPLVVEISPDGNTYEEIGRRETYFGTSPPWIVPAHGRTARYVRVRVARRSYLALSEIEVFGTKTPAPAASAAPSVSNAGEAGVSAPRP